MKTDRLNFKRLFKELSKAFITYIMKTPTYIILGSLIAASQMQGRADQPASQSTLNDLRLSRAYLSTGYVSDSDRQAIAQIDLAVNDIKQTSTDDSKSPIDHPQIDSGTGGDRFSKARQLLDKAHDDVQRALTDIDAARDKVHDIELHPEAWQAPLAATATGSDPSEYNLSSADPAVDYSPFYQSLADQGTWIDVPNYGYVFQPKGTDANWAPYTNGYWGSTDAGLTWISSESFGWATYHYGRWTHLNQPNASGWVWIPGNTWAPAWVSWRHGINNGQSFYGWVPLPPENGVQSGSPVIGNDVDVTLNIRSEDYHFVQETYLGSADYKTHYVSQEQSLDLVKVSTNQTKITVNQTANADQFHRVTVGGPVLSEIHSDQAIPRVDLKASSNPTSPEKEAFYTPTLNKRMASTPRPTPRNHEERHDAVANTPIISNEPKTDATQKDLAQKNTEQKDAEQKDLAQKNAEQKDAAQKDLAQKNAEQKDAAQKDLAQKNAEQKDAAQKDLAQKNAEQKDAAQKDLAQKNAEQKDAAQKDLAQKNAEQKDAAQKDLAQKNAEQKDAEQKDLAQKNAEQKDAEQKDLAQKNAEQKDAEQKDLAQKNAEQKDAEQKDLAQKNAEQKDAAQKDLAQKNAEQKEVAQKDAQQKAITAKDETQKPTEKKIEKQKPSPSSP